MAYVKTHKAIKIEKETLVKIEEMKDIMEAIAHELEEINDEEYHDLSSLAWNAHAYLYDFMGAYETAISFD